VRIVYNLYPINETLFLPSANVVEEDRGGQLTHIVQKATASTVVGYGLRLDEVAEDLFKRIERLSPKAIEGKFKPPKAKSPLPLNQLLAQAETKPAVEQFISRELGLFLDSIWQHRLPITLDAEKRTLAKDVLLSRAENEVSPKLTFKKTPEGITYSFGLLDGEHLLNIRERDFFPLTNTNPAWAVSQYVLYRIQGINGNMIRPFRGKDLLHIPPDKVRLYFKQFIAKNAGRTEIEAEGFALKTAQSIESARLCATEHILDKTWLLQLSFQYGGESFAFGEKRLSATRLFVPDEEAEEIEVHVTKRDVEREAEFAQSLFEMGLQDDCHYFRVAEAASFSEVCRWLSKHKTELQSKGIEVLAPELDGNQVALLDAQIEVQSRVENDWFDVHGTVTVGSFSFPFRAFVPYLRKEDPYFPLPDGRFYLIPDEWFARYGELALALKETGESLRLPKALFTLLKGVGELGNSAAFDEIDPETIDYQPSSELKATLRPYQLYGTKWLIGHYQRGFGACLADDMGLGKTLQTIAALLYAKESRKTGAQPAEAGGRAQLDLFQSYQESIKPLQALVVLPASLVFNWQKELALFAPSLFVYAHTGPKRLKDIRAIAGHDVVLTTYQTARQDLSLLEKMPWHAIVLDESQQIKNRDSEVSKVVRALKAQFKISLSGTPIENSLADLWTQMEFINPDTFGSFREFKEAYILPIEKWGDEAAKQRLVSRIQPFFLRRTKEEVAPDLPLLSEQVFYSEMSAGQQKLYDKTKSAVRNEILNLFDDPKTRIMALQALMRLRQLANHPVLLDPDSTIESGKCEDVLEQWRTVQRAGHKVLFFSTFEKHLQIFRRKLEEQESPYAWLTGETPTSERPHEVKRFQEDPQVQAFFMTLKAGGVGLNLTAADYVFLLDPWWNPAAEDQAIARAHRIGQQRPVTVLRFISRNTIEEKIRALQERKKKLGQALFEKNAEVPRLTREELEMLLG
jgi:non-specific serine/threonine protein kinase